MFRLRDFSSAEPSKARVEAIVDGIFSVAMTLLVLDIKLPGDTRFESNRDLLAHLGSVTAALTTYVISFVALAMLWVAHNYQFRYVERVDRPLLWINLLFLLVTTTVPFTTSVVSTNPELSASVTLYALNLSLLVALLLMHARRLRVTPGLSTSEFTETVARNAESRLWLICLVPILAIVVAQFSARWGMRTFYLLAVIHFFRIGPPNISRKAGVPRE
jgi:uncharacterized membrane protein